MKIKYRCVFNRANRLNKMGLGLIQVEAYQSGRKAYFSTNVFVAKDQFDGIVINHPHATELNGIIIELIMKLESIELNLWKHGIEPTLNHLRASWREKRDMTDFSSFALREIERSNRKVRTKQNLCQTVNKIQQFRKVSLLDIDHLFLKDFEEWLRKSRISNNTVHKEMRNLRTLIGEAVHAGLINENPFLRYKMPKSEKKEHVFLTESEINQIASSSLYPEIRDAFLFCCRTGLRFSDYQLLDESNFQIIRGRVWLIYTTVKTGIEVRVPIFLFGSLPHPHIASNATANKSLRALCNELGIRKAVTFHTARHTFATIMLSRGIPITSVQQMLGHTSVRMTERYAETTFDKLESDILKIARV
mgnify:CR=1 FL=1